MYREIYDWLCRNKELKIPGVGIFQLQRQAAAVDFRNKQILPPIFIFSFESRDQPQPPSRNFFNWVSSMLNISDREAIIRFNDFVFDLRKELSDGNAIDWKGIGILNQQANGEIHFTPQQKASTYLQPVLAEKIIRENASHRVRVGEKETTTGEMTQLLNLPAKKKASWRFWATLAGLLAIIFIVWYFVVNGLEPSVAGNAQKLQIGPADASYRILP